ncbi:dynein light chain LC6 [Pyrus ussuriensis x Pyrus communis]|uniref:Dynein light chain LC6 n=1 Tax=Pyrus ussuriensis x Pyrus communis TaxID=2448454 RepID=A0A5N5GJV6_9ROSA|nr:dynein light chain LC6 [Pyrus ussuriensis x Pyrus communis]
MLEGKAVIVETDMLQTMQQKALDLTSKALDLFDVTEATEIGRFIKKDIWTWMAVHCRSRFWFICYSHGCFIYFCVGSLAVLMFRGAAGPEAEAKQPCAAALEAIQAGSSYSLHHFVL